jgi:hypothetical protein
VQVPDERTAHGSRMLPCPVEPVQNAIRRVLRKPGHSSQTVALIQERQGFEHHRARTAHGLEEGVLILTKGASARRAVVAVLDITENLEVACCNVAKIRTGFVVTPLPLEFPDASPPPKQMIRPIASHGLRIHSEVFTAYRYSTENRILGHSTGSGR